MSVLYVGTFGSFIGYSFAFGLVLQNQFGRTPLQAADLTFIGPLLGSLVRPVGGRLADRFGGGRITWWNFLAMAAATGVVIGASEAKSLPAFLVGFIALFVLSGIGNGSSYKMIPGIFQKKAEARGLTGEEAAAYGRRLSGASMGLIGAVGALGGVGINLAFRESFLDSGVRHPRLRVLPGLLRGVLRGHLGRIPAAAGRSARRAPGRRPPRPPRPMRRSERPARGARPGAGT